MTYREKSGMLYLEKKSLYYIRIRKTFKKLVPFVMFHLKFLCYLKHLRKTALYLFVLKINLTFKIFLKLYMQQNRMA